MPNKTCFKCHRELPSDEFYKHPRMGDGHLGKCKECTRMDVSLNRYAKQDYYNEYDRRRFKESPKRKAQMYATARRMRKLYPEKSKARYALGNAIRDGKIHRKPCEICGSETRIEGHHEDYSKPLEVIWLCVKHHKAIHAKLMRERTLRQLAAARQESAKDVAA